MQHVCKVWFCRWKCSDRWLKRLLLAIEKGSARAGLEGNFTREKSRLKGMGCPWTWVGKECWNNRNTKIYRWYFNFSAVFPDYTPVLSESVPMKMGCSMYSDIIGCSTDYRGYEENLGLPLSELVEVRTQQKWTIESKIDRYCDIRLHILKFYFFWKFQWGPWEFCKPRNFVFIAVWNK